MTENSYLNPTDIKNQCSKATINLNKDNESIAVAEASMDLFINDSEIKGDAFDALKQQINDYKVVIEALRSANDSDIADFNTLSNSVGDEVLDGRNILSQKNAARAAKESHVSSAQHYEREADNAYWPWMSWYYSAKASYYWSLADSDQRLYDKWQAKEDAYDNIESATCNLFSASTGTRSAAVSAMNSIAEAFVDGTYQPNMGAKWRTDIVECYIKRLISISDNGEPVINMREVEKILAKKADEITPKEYDAVMLAFLNADEKQLGEFLKYIMDKGTSVDLNFVEEWIGMGAGTGGQDFTEWNINKEKLSEIQKRAAIQSEIMLCYMKELRSTEYQENFYHIEKQRMEIIQRLTLLEVVEGIGVFRGVHEAPYPMLAVNSGDEGEIIVDFWQYRNIGSEMSPVFSNIGKSSVTIGRTEHSSYIIDRAIENAKYNFATRFGKFEVSEEVGKFVNDKITGEVIGNGAENLSKYVAVELGKETMGKMIGYVPLVGDVIGFSTEMAQDAIKAEQDAAFISEQFDQLESAAVYGDYGCNANFVDYDTGDNKSTVIWAYAGEDTDKIIKLLNDELSWNVSREQLFNNPNELQKLEDEIQNDTDKSGMYYAITRNKYVGD